MIKKNVYSNVPSETQREGISAAQKWACGLIDGDGHIGMEWSDRAKTKWVPLLKVSLHIYNARAIYKLKVALGCGNITFDQTMITLRVRKRAHWRDKLLPLWNKFPLRSSKHYDAMCVARALAFDPAKLLKKDEQAMINKLKLVLKQNRTSTIPSPIWGLCQPYSSFSISDKQQLSIALDLDWLAGFIEAEGSFYILQNGQHGFALGQAYNTHIVAAIREFYNIKAALKCKPNYVMLDTKNHDTLQCIAKTMNKRLLGMKSFVFTLWWRTLKKKDKYKSLKARRIIRKIRSPFVQRC